MIKRTVRAFQECDAVKYIVIVTREDLILPINSLCREFSKVMEVVAGGKTRQESVERGVNVLDQRVELVAIHDGARPLITWQLIDRCIRAANTYGTAAPAIPVKDTIKTVEGGIVVNTPERAKLRAVQTPQVFDLDLLHVALVDARENGAEVTDDCSAVERLGMKVKIVEGDEKNIKVTTPMDLRIARMLLEEQK